MVTRLKKYNSGITIVEILVVLAVLVVLVSFAAPSISGANSAMQLRAAEASVQHSIDMARNTARRTEAPVTLNILTDPENGRQQLTMTLSDSAQKRLSQTEMPEFHLDESLAFISAQETFEFDGRGIVTNPGHLTLVVRDEDSHSASFIIE